MHAFTDEIFAQHRPDDGQTVSPAGERCTSGTLEMHVPRPAVGVRDLAEQEGAPVAEPGGVPAKLVARVSLRDRRGINGEPMPGQQAHPFGTS